MRRIFRVNTGGAVRGQGHLVDVEQARTRAIVMLTPAPPRRVGAAVALRRSGSSEGMSVETRMMTHREDPSRAAAYESVPLSPAGAEIRGLDLREPLDPATAEALRASFAKHHVLVFRDQDLTPADQIRVLGAFGNVLDESNNGARHSYVSGDAKSTTFKPGRLLFHSDNHFTQVPLEMLSLYGENVDQAAASTLFVDNVQGLKRLPAELAAKLADAKSVNVSYYFWGQGGDRPSRSVQPERAEAPQAVHPVIWRHPVSGEPFIYITELHTHHLLDMPLDASDDLLAAVREVLYAPDGMYEHRWRTGDLVIWDNRAVQHARGFVPDSTADPAAPNRSIRRVVVGPKDFRDQVTLPDSVTWMN
jgi:taurine dioxygenase